jgi:DNA replication protein DnaC
MDLKHIIKKFIVPSFQYTEDDVFSFLPNKDKILERFKQSNIKANPEDSIEDVVDYIDFQESWEIIFKNKILIPRNVLNDIKNREYDLRSLVPIRNDLAHARPYTFESRELVKDFISKLTNEDIWYYTIGFKNNIESNEYLLKTQELRSFESDSSVYHNLPPVEFDETGFIGRESDLEKIKQLIDSHISIISIVGIGGVGKTALALKIAYDIIKDSGSKFDAVIWFSAKEYRLTRHNLVEIKDSIKDVYSLIKNIANEISTAHESVESTIEEINKELEKTRILLIIDNLETFENDRIREIIGQIKNCKILITSRVGLGELEKRYEIQGLKSSDAIKLLKAVVYIRNSKLLLSSNKEDEYVKKLDYNPLSIKWFVDAVEEGFTPDQILNDKSELEEFCLSNIYNKLQEEAKGVLLTILGYQQPITHNELCYLSGIDPYEVQKGINNLCSSSFVTRLSSKSNSGEVIYSVSEFVKNYLSRNHAPSKILT